ncbi:MAG: dTMP kinase [Anaerolineaceae bacterium]|jgi:dTMP kinase|nr:MAG: dTMP kinase [Anaerolineaceae bacterium]
MFITLEGPDGSGKTQQIQLLADFLVSKGYKVFSSREPGGTEIGDKIRAILMDLHNTTMHPRTETLLFCASRAQIVEQVIKPKLQEGFIVILDRYADSTLAYQGYGHGNDLKMIRELLTFATGGLKPDLTILLDLDPEVGLKRRKQGGGEWNRLDAYQLALHKRVRAGYLEMAAQEPERWRIISADRSIEVVQSNIQKIILDYLE